jgi:hypothetical protein
MARTLKNVRLTPTDRWFMLREQLPWGVVDMLSRQIGVKPSYRRRIAALVALALVPSVLLGGTSAAHAANVAPTGIAVAASTDNTGLGGAVPDVLVEAGDPFTLVVSLLPAGAAFEEDTSLTLTATLDPSVGGSPHGSFTPSTITMPAGVSTESFSVSYSAPDNGVTLTASVTDGVVTPGVTSPFDVLATLLQLTQGDPRFGAGVGVGDADCAKATTEPLCGVLVLPEDIESPRGALSIGRCTDNLGCRSGSQVVQFVADLGARYTPSAPATLIFRCDKALCRSSNNGVKGFTLKVSQLAGGPLDHVSQPCARKGVADNGLNNGDTFCTDYRQSHRDNSGDLLLYLLFTEDMRGST